jgi:hypothetical protein
MTQNARMAARLRTMKIPRRQFLHLGRMWGRALGGVTGCACASLSIAPDHHAGRLAIKTDAARSCDTRGRGGREKEARRVRETQSAAGYGATSPSSAQSIPDRTCRGKREAARAQRAVAGRLARGRPAAPGDCGMISEAERPPLESQLFFQASSPAHRSRSHRRGPTARPQTHPRATATRLRPWPGGSSDLLSDR